MLHLFQDYNKSLRKQICNITKSQSSFLLINNLFFVDIIMSKMLVEIKKHGSSCAKALHNVHCIKKISWRTTRTMQALYYCMTGIMLTCPFRISNCADSVQFSSSTAQTLNRSRKSHIDKSHYLYLED